ncbi:MAG: glycosyltransferase family 2 protein [Candidatus Nealsonbacteria bacterium]|nr:glycosyltransferase family 2 protein [Candidatus Nealsonbacteria bacterium]
MSSLPFVSIIIPARNEEKFILKCLETIVGQDFPKENLEVLVVDGASEDKTKEIAFLWSQQYPWIRILDNPRKFTPFGLNIGIHEARGEIIVRMDAHAGYAKDYVLRCVNHLLESGADNVGGTMRTLPSENTLTARAISLCLTSPFGAASSFRLGVAEPQEVDTVFGGCWRKSVFSRIGFFNEKMIRSQDLEFNLRLKKAGGKIMLFPDIVVEYYPQSALGKFFKHNWQDGIWSIYPLKFIKTGFKLRHYLPLIFILTLPLSVWPYSLVSLVFSLKIALRERDARLFLLMPVVFGARHFGYGLGSLFGVVKLLAD